PFVGSASPAWSSLRTPAGAECLFPREYTRNLRAGREHKDLQDLGGAPVLNESHHPGIGALRPRQERQGALLGDRRPGKRQRTLPFEHHMVVRERASAVLSGAYAAFEAVFIGRQVKAH